MKYDGYVVGPILRKLREDRGYSLTRLSEVTGLSVSTLIQMEQGGRNLSMKSLYVLMELYKVDANTILGIVNPSIQGLPKWKKRSERILQLPFSLCWKMRKR